MRDILPLLAEFSIQSTVWQKDVRHFLILNFKYKVDMGVGLHSCKTAVKIADYIAKDIKNEIHVFTKIIEQNKPVLIIFLKFVTSHQ